MKTRKKHTKKSETPICTCKKGSLTLESAVVIPVLVFVFASILMIFRILQVQTAVQESATYATRKTAAMAVNVESDSVALSMAKGYYFHHVSKYEVVKKYMKGSWIMTNFNGSSCTEDDILLKISYEIKMPIKFANIDAIRIFQTSHQRRWTGDKPRLERDDDVDYVYITETGYAYHRDINCSHIDLSIHSIDKKNINSARNQSGGKYYKCSHCVKNNQTQYYITDYGTNYHSDKNCSGLKRSIKRVKLSEAKGKSPCKSCGGNN